MVAASLAKQVDLPAGSFGALANTVAEAQAAVGGERMGGRLIVEFRKADLARAMRGERVGVLHLATHASSMAGRSGRSSSRTANRFRLSELRGLVGGARGRGEQLELLVLSACETAGGDDQASMGLAGATVQAGAVSALASLWQVDDAGTVQLMQAFYDGFYGGQGKAQSLRGAQLKLIRAGGGSADPNIWAAFTLLGGWR